MKRSLSLILVLVMIFSMLSGVIAGAKTASDKGTLEINEASIAFGSDVYLLIAVDYSGLDIDVDTAKADVTVKVSHKNSAEPEELIVDESVMATMNFPENSVGFKCEIGAKNMGDVLTLQAYYNDEASGASLEYSILEYAIKAKALYSDNEYLVDALDKMLMFGAAAQKAFDYEGDYTLYDENGYVEHGIVSIFNSNSKVIAPVNSVIAPTAPEGEVDPILYDYSFNRMADNEIVVEKGVNSYFFISSDDRTVYSFDATNPTLTSDMLDCENTSSSLKKKTVWTDEDGNFYSEWADGLARQTLQVGKVKSGKPTVTKLIKDEDGNNLALMMSPQGSSYAVQLRQRISDANDKNQVAANLGDVFTLSVVIGKEGSTYMAPSAYRFYGEGGTGVVSIFGLTNSGNSSTFCETNNTGAPITDVVTDGVGYSFITVHMVVDLVAHTISYYTNDSATPVAVVYKETLTASRIYASSGYLFEAYLNSVGTVLLQKIMYTKGNIFE